MEQVHTDKYMQTIVAPKYGTPDKLKLQVIEKPMVQKNNVLVKIFSASVNQGDRHILRGEPFFIRLMGNGLFKPKTKYPGLISLDGSKRSVTR